MSPATIIRRVREERGFTMVELLVSISMASVIMLALVAILEFSTRQTARITDVTEADQLGRTAMAKVVSDLDSACISPSFTPILEKSNETELRFINAYSEAAVISEAKPEAYLHEIKWSKTTGKLIDHIFPDTGGTWPNFTFTGSTETPKGGLLLAKGVEETKSESTGKALPVFQYYSYTTAASSSNDTALSTISSTTLEPQLTENEAAKAASVLVRFTVAPPESTTILGSAGEHTHVPLSNQVTLSFSVPKSETTTVDAPCE